MFWGIWWATNYRDFFLERSFHLNDSFAIYIEEKEFLATGADMSSSVAGKRGRDSPWDNLVVTIETIIYPLDGQQLARLTPSS